MTAMSDLLGDLKSFKAAFTQAGVPGKFKLTVKDSGPQLEVAVAPAHTEIAHKLLRPDLRGGRVVIVTT